MNNNGRKASLWWDDWTGLGLLRSCVNGPLNSEEDIWTVSDIIDEDGSWNFTVMSMQLPQNVVQTIWAIPVQHFNSGEDCLSWTSSPDGKFNIKSTYHLAQGSVGMDNTNCKWVLKTQTHLKNKHFVWLLVHQRVITGNYLKLIGIVGDDLCLLCSGDSEIAQHLVKDCPGARGLWDQLQAPQPTPSASFFDWLKSNCSNSKPSHHMNLLNARTGDPGHQTCASGEK
ncbi:hypothetical protein COLO4_35381 [Corchorus olitorius]|uniref:Reverse transcriptase zinc-binding domain-containing protein n=1 Tax=Corchorus olitorius TaxID=93759 RepID=A0A1R3GH66_9ROSI|nr:hypothetical protein COLO4_35381 [Corchorus olitorius]